MRSLSSRVPESESLLSLEPEELGLHLLFLLQREPGQHGAFVLANCIDALVGGYQESQREEAMDAVVEAWAWLESQALLIPARRQMSNYGWRTLSRRAKTMSTAADFVGFRLGTLLPREAMHSAIPLQVRPNFLRGDYDTAVFQSMRQVEITLRDATRFTDETSGVRLARKAFHVETGPLTDMNAEPGERQAVMELFSGALGTLKNPHSHRSVQMDEPGDAAAAILLASYLLRLIDNRVHLQGLQLR